VEDAFAAANCLTASPDHARPPRVKSLHDHSSAWLRYVIILGPGRKTAACQLQSIRAALYLILTIDNQEIFPMKKILIAVSAFALFAAYSGIARAQDEATKTETTETKGAKKTKKSKKTEKTTDAAGAGTTGTETKTETKTEKPAK
jgi:hypothetical protein